MADYDMVYQSRTGISILLKEKELHPIWDRVRNLTELYRDTCDTETLRSFLRPIVRGNRSNGDGGRLQ